MVAGVWLAGTVLATGTGLLAVRTVATQVGDPTVPVLRGDDVAQALDAPGDAIPAPAASGGAGPRPSSTAVPSSSAPAASPPPAPASSPSAAGRAPASSAPATFRSSGGAVGVQCVGATARLLFATPALGYALEQRSASGSTVTVRFEASASRSRLRVGCATGRPVLIESRDDSRGGGGSDGSGSDDSRDDDSGSDGSGRDEPREDGRGSDGEDD